MSIAEKFEVIADEVYEKGKDYIWEVVQQKGNRPDYSYAFIYWDIDYIRPKYKVIPTHEYSTNQTFTKSKIKKVEKEYFDFSQKTHSTNSQAGCYYMFSTCTNLEEIEDIKMPLVPNYTYAFAWSDKLHTIGFPLKCDETTAWGNAFTRCSALKNIEIEGVIGKSGFNVSACTKLSGESIVSIIEALSTTTSGLTVTLSQMAVNSMVFPIVGKKGTYNSWTELEQSRTNWTISLV